MFNIARCIDKGIEISELKDEYFTKAEYYLKSEEEMLKIFSQLKQSINNTKYIADRCNVDFDFKTYHLPEYTVPDGFTTKEAVSYTHLRAHETSLHLVCRLLLEKKKIPSL